MKYAYIVLILWIVLVALTLPYARELSKVLLYKEEAFLPENVESIVAEDIAKEKFGGNEGQKTLIVVLKNVNPYSEELREKYFAFKNDAKIYTENITTIYDILKKAQEKYDETITNISKEVYDEVYDNLYENITEIHKGLYELKNATRNFEDFYFNLTDKLMDMHESVYDIEEALIELDKNFTDATKYIKELHRGINNLRYTIIMLNSTYGEVYKNITYLHTLTHNLANMLLQYNMLFYNGSYLYSYTLWDSSRSHFYLLNLTDAYLNPPIDTSDLEVLVFYTNLTVINPLLKPVDLYVANMTYYYVLTNYPFKLYNLNDEAFVTLSSNITKNVLLKDIPSDMKQAVILWIDIYATYFNLTLNEWKLRNNVTYFWKTYSIIPGEKPPLTAYYSQVENLDIALDIGNNALNASTTVYASAIAPIMAKETGLPESLIEDLIKEAYELGPAPSHSKIKNALIRIISKMDIVAPFNVTRLVSELYDLGPSPPSESLQEISKNILKGLVKTYIVSYNVPEKVVTNLIDKIVEIYPLTDDEIRILTVNTVMASGKIPEDFKEAVLSLYSLGPKAGDLSYKTIVYRLFIKQIKDEKAKILLKAEMAYGPDISKDKVKLRNAVLYSLKEIIDIENITIEDFSKEEVYDLMQRLYDLGPNPLKSAIENIAKELVYDKLEKLTNETEIDYDIVKKLIDMMFSKVLPLSERDVREIVIDIFYDEFSDMISEKEELNETFSHINIKEFLEDIYDIGEHLKEDRVDIIASKYASIIRDSILEEIIKKHPRPSSLNDIPKEIVSSYVPKDNVLIIVVSPLGTSETDRYEISLKIRDLALKAFTKQSEVFGTLSLSKPEIYILGSALSEGEMKIYGQKDIDIIDKVSSTLTLIVMILVLGSILAFFIPLINVGVALVITFAIMYFIALYVMNVGSWARIFVITTTLGAGVDYTTYYLLRFKEELKELNDPIVALKNTIRKVTTPILISGLTTAAGFASLAFAWNFPFMRMLGVTIPIGILIVLTASLTLTPALLKITKGRVWLPRLKAAKRIKQPYSRIAQVVVKYAPSIFLVLIALSIPIGFTIITFKGSHDFSILLPENSITIQSINALRRVIDQGILSPTIIIIEFKDNVWSNESLKIIEELCEKIESIEGVSKIYTPTRPLGEPLTYPYNMSEMKNKGAFNYVGNDNRTVMLQVILKYFPYSDSATNVVSKLKDKIRSYENPKISRILVGGVTAKIVDLDYILNRAFKERILVAAITLTFIILAVLLRSIPLALSSIALIMFNVAISIYVTEIVFTKIMNKPLIWFLPLVVFTVLLGISIDYISYFINRAKEELDRMSTAEAAVVASGSISKLILGLALIVVAAYGSLLLASSWAMKGFGFVLAFGILFTGITIPYIIGPMTLALLNDKAWWPGKIKRK